MNLTIDDVMADLEYGRTAWSGPDRRIETITGLPRPTLGGGAFGRAYLTARLLGAIHPRLVRRSLLRLWFTPWVHPSALAPVTDVPAGLAPWTHATDATNAADATNAVDGTDGVVLHGFQGGAGETIVLLHGWSGRAADMRHLAGDLVAAGWRVVAPNLPAHGLTGGERTDLFELAAAVASVLRHERPAVVVTHSMGFPALNLALESDAPAPARVVAVAPGRKMVRALDGFARRAGLGERLVAELRRGIEARFGPGVWQTLDVDRVLADLTPAGLVVHDVDDDEVPIDDARHIAAAWPGAQLLETAGLGHRRILRDPCVREQVVDWLRATAAPAEPERAVTGHVAPDGVRSRAG